MIFCLLYTSYLWKDCGDVVELGYRGCCCVREGEMMCVVDRGKEVRWG